MEIKKIYRENKNKVIVALVFKPFKFRIIIIIPDFNAFKN